MTWRSFMDFYLMRELGHEDAIIRNYIDLRTDSMHDNHACVYSAIVRIGLPVEKGNWKLAVYAVMQMLVNMGLERPDFDVVRIRLNQYYQWDKIRTGESRYPRPLKQGANPLLD